MQCQEEYQLYKFSVTWASDNREGLPVGGEGRSREERRSGAASVSEPVSRPRREVEGDRCICCDGGGDGDMFFSGTTTAAMVVVVVVKLINKPTEESKESVNVVGYIHQRSRASSFCWDVTSPDFEIRISVYFWCAYFWLFCDYETN